MFTINDLFQIQKYHNHYFLRVTVKNHPYDAHPFVYWMYIAGKHITIYHLKEHRILPNQSDEYKFKSGDVLLLKSDSITFNGNDVIDLSKEYDMTMIKKIVKKYLKL